jgi:hypothetical protein
VGPRVVAATRDYAVTTDHNGCIAAYDRDNHDCSADHDHNHNHHSGSNHNGGSGHNDSRGNDSGSIGDNARDTRTASEDAHSDRVPYAIPVANSVERLRHGDSNAYGHAYRDVDRHVYPHAFRHG